MVAAAAREIRGGHVVFVGMRLPLGAAEVDRHDYNRDNEYYGEYHEATRTRAKFKSL